VAGFAWHLLHHLDGSECARWSEAVHDTEQPHHVQPAEFVCVTPHCLLNWLFPATCHNKIMSPLNHFGPVNYWNGISTYTAKGRDYKTLKAVA
jgi:hypothetical protein